MKNTKHTEMNDSSIEQDNQENLSQSKRKILTSIGVTSGVVGASALVPSTWVKPAVNSVILPAHAQQTPPMNGTTLTPTTTPMGMGPTTMMPTTMMPTTMMPTTMMPTTMMPTTMMPTTMMPTTMMPAAGILLEKSNNTGKVGNGNTISYFVTLRDKPTGDVEVAITSEPADLVTTDDTPATFTRAGFGTEEAKVVVTAPSGVVAADPSVTITFTAAGVGSGYDGMTVTDTFTVIQDDNIAPAAPVATRGTGFGNRKDVTVTWMAPATAAVVLGYVVSTGVEDVDDMDVEAPKTMTTFMGMPAGGATFQVRAVYASGESGVDQTSPASNEVTIPA